MGSFQPSLFNEVISLLYLIIKKKNKIKLVSVKQTCVPLFEGGGKFPTVVSSQPDSLSQTPSLMCLVIINSMMS